MSAFAAGVKHCTSLIKANITVGTCSYYLMTKPLRTIANVLGDLVVQADILVTDNRDQDCSRLQMIFVKTAVSGVFLFSLFHTTGIPESIQFNSTTFVWHLLQYITSTQILLIVSNLIKYQKRNNGK